MTIFSTGAGVFISMAVGFLSAPISLNYWKEEKFAILSIIISLITYLSVSSLGLNSAAATLIAKNKDFEDKIKILKKSFHFLIILVILFIITLFFIQKNTSNWIFIFGKISPDLVGEVSYATFLMAFFFFINLPFSLISSALFGFQKVYIDKAFNTFSAILNFIILLLIVYLKESLIFFSLLSGLSNLLISMIRSFYFYFFIYKKESNFIHNKINYSKNPETSLSYIVKTGLKMFSINLAAMVIWNTDNIVIAHFIDIKKVTPYSLTYKFYNLIFTLLIIINTAINPIIGKEIANKNWEWLDKVFNHFLVIVAFFGGLTWLGGILFAKDFIYLWIGNQGYAGLMVCFFLGGYSYLMIVINLNSMLLTSMNYLNNIPIISWAESLLNIGLSIFLLRFFHLGGVAMGTFLGSLLTTAWLFPLLIQKKMKNKINCNFSFIFKHFLILILPLLFLSLWIQLSVNFLYLRIVFGAIIILIYLIFSYKIIPKETKYFLIENIILILNKLNLKKISIFFEKIKK